MKKSKLVVKYIVFSIILYILGIIVLFTLPTQTSGSSEMFAGLEEALHTMLTLVILISIIELIGGIYLLTKNLQKNILKKAFISLFIVIIGLVIIFYPLSLLLIIFIIPISSIIINYSIESKKYIKIVYLLIFILLLARIVLQISDYINFNKEQNTDNVIEYPCTNYLTSNSNAFYCFSTDQIKKINKNNLDKKIYNSADYLFYDFLRSNSFMHNASNNNYIYYTIYKARYGSTDANYELHVIDVNNNTDTIIIYLKKETIVSAITDENGNLFFTSENYNNQMKSYYYQPNKNKLTKISNDDYLDFYYLKNNKLYYEINNGGAKRFYSYDILNNKKTDNGYMENDPNIIMNSVFTTINNYRYQFYDNEIYKYDINDYSQRIIIKTNQDYRINEIRLNNNKIYYFHIDNNTDILLGYYDVNNNSITNINYGFKTRNSNYIINGDSFYYINSDNEHLYKYNLSNKNVEEFNNTKVNTILGIDMDTIYLKTKANDYEVINLDTKETIFLEKELNNF